MDPDVVELLHRIEHKLDLLIYDCPNFYKFDEERKCPICDKDIRFEQNANAVIARRCGCTMKLKPVDYSSYGPKQ